MDILQGACDPDLGHVGQGDGVGVEGGRAGRRTRGDLRRIVIVAVLALHPAFIAGAGLAVLGISDQTVEHAELADAFTELVVIPAGDFLDDVWNRKVREAEDRGAVRVHPLAGDRDTDEGVGVARVGDRDSTLGAAVNGMCVTFLVSFLGRLALTDRDRVLDLDVDVVDADGVGAEFAGLPHDALLAEGLAEVDGPLVVFAVDRVLDRQGHRAVGVESLGDEPEGLGAVRVVQVVLVAGAVPGAAELVVLSGFIVDRAVKGLGGDGGAGSRRVRPLGRARGGVVGLVVLVVVLGDRGDLAGAAVDEVVEDDLFDDDVLVFHVPDRELHGREGVVEQDRSAVGEEPFVLLLRHLPVGEEDVLLLLGLCRGGVGEGELATVTTSDGYARGRRRHVEVEVDGPVRPGIVGVVAPIAPAVAEIRVLAGIQVVIHVGVGRRRREASAVAPDAEFVGVERAKILSVGRGALGREGELVQAYHGLLQEELAALLGLEGDDDALTDRRGHFGRARAALEGEHDVVFADLHVIERLLPLAGGQRSGRKNRHHDVELLHNFSLSWVRTRNTGAPQTPDCPQPPC